MSYTPSLTVVLLAAGALVYDTHLQTSAYTLGIGLHSISNEGV